MDNDEIIDKLVGIRNRAIILMWILENNPPEYVIGALPTLYEDNGEYTQAMMLDRCVINKEDL